MKVEDRKDDYQNGNQESRKHNKREKSIKAKAVF